MIVHAREPAVSVVIPSYRRPRALADCVRSLVECTLKPAEIVVVGRQGDTETEHALQELRPRPNSTIPLRSGWVSVPGHIPPVEAGIHLASGEIVAIVDDDVTVQPDWLEHILPHFADSRVGIVGGRVVAPGTPRPKLKGKPGKVSWYGKHWGNVASLEGRIAIQVDSVMECNWAWRRSLLASLRFDPVLNFDDAAMYGLDLCLQAKRKGFRVIYEPLAVVYHHVAPRVAELDRADRQPRSFSYCRNQTYIMLKHLPWWRQPIFLGWWFGIGERGAWGIGALVADTLLNGLRLNRNVVSSVRGKIEGIQLWLRS